MGKTAVMIRLGDEELALLDSYCQASGRTRAGVTHMALMTVIADDRGTRLNPVDDPDHPSDEKDTSRIVTTTWSLADGQAYLDKRDPVLAEVLANQAKDVSHETTVSAHDPDWKPGTVAVDPKTTERIREQLAKKPRAEYPKEPKDCSHNYRQRNGWCPTCGDQR